MTTCDSCGYEWEYTGSLSRATCPNCSGKTYVEYDRECHICGADTDLHRHHVSYERDEIVVLCREHHDAVHNDADHPLYPDDEVSGVQLLEHFTDEEHAALFAVKGARTWREAILEEFDVEVGTEVVEA